uniref:Uncharacterized protein n=1 Tax=Mycena chlorophos TaxID=658473 RepID=A0ABQ0KXP9_MYCCL|nr:predicted protein [Mycena chlorophos]
MPRDSPFTDEQDDYIDTYMAAWVEQLEAEPPRTNRQLKTWRETTSSKIIESTDFKDKLDFALISKEKWFEVRSKIFFFYR